MIVTPRTYVLLKRPLKQREEPPVIVTESESLDTVKDVIWGMVRNRPGKWIAKNGRSAHYYDRHRDRVVRLWIKRKRPYE